MSAIEKVYEKIEFHSTPLSRIKCVIKNRGNEIDEYIKRDKKIATAGGGGFDKDEADEDMKMRENDGGSTKKEYTKVEGDVDKSVILSEIIRFDTDVGLIGLNKWTMNFDDCLFKVKEPKVKR